MLKNKIVLITGASSGIGAACAGQFAKAGAKLILCARRIKIINELAEQLTKKFQTEIICVVLDVKNYSEIKKQLSTLPEKFKNIDILINNAGLAAGRDAVQNADVNDWEEMINTNIKGLLYMTHEILPQMITRNAGHIINVRFKGDVERAAKVYEGFEPLKASDIADAILYCATRPAHVNVSEILIMPTAQVAVGMIARK